MEDGPYGGLKIKSVHPQGQLVLESPIPGIYNAYNILAAVNAALELGITPGPIIKAVASFLPREGRRETFYYQDKTVTIVLVKNPDSFNVALKSLIPQRGRARYIMALNDLPADGRDISWIWEADLDPLMHRAIPPVICSGLRGGEVALYLKYCGLKEEDITLVPLGKGLDLLLSPSYPGGRKLHHMQLYWAQKVKASSAGKGSGSWNYTWPISSQNCRPVMGIKAISLSCRKGPNGEI
ncbi:MAG TPA: Mur ligase family protein [Moorella mulderi]|nr:Mur ligase family protein [Moorella mulderi]